MDIEKVLDSTGIKFTTVKHVPVFTVTESMEYMPGKYPVKNLLLKEEKGDRCVFVICKGDERLDTKLIQREVGCKKLQFAKPEVLMDRLGVEPGSASLFSLLNPNSEGVEVVIDSRILAQPEVGFYPLVNTSTIYISGKDIKLFLDGLGHVLYILAF